MTEVVRLLCDMKLDLLIKDLTKGMLGFDSHSEILDSR